MSIEMTLKEFKTWIRGYGFKDSKVEENINKHKLYLKKIRQDRARLNPKRKQIRNKPRSKK